MKPRTYTCTFWCGSLCWGIFFLLIGGYFLAKHFGWITVDFPFWPTLLIALGLYLVLRSFGRKY